MRTDSTHKGRVLLGESVRQTASQMKQALEGAGYQVDEAPDGEVCLQKAKGSHPDLVVLDILLPKVHGIEVLKELRADPGTAGTGVMVCTARDFKTDHIEAAVLGVHEYLVKPVEPQTLVAKVDEFFAARENGGPPPVTQPEDRGTPDAKPFVPEFD